MKDVIKPFCGLFFAAFTVLIVWTAVERPVWKREFEIGFCYEVMYFGVAMDLIMIVAISLTLWWGHKTRDLPEDISDSKRVYYTLVAQFILLMRKASLLFVAFDSRCFMHSPCQSNPSRYCLLRSYPCYSRQYLCLHRWRNLRRCIVLNMLCLFDYP